MKKKVFYFYKRTAYQIVCVILSLAILGIMAYNIWGSEVHWLIHLLSAGILLIFAAYDYYIFTNRIVINYSKQQIIFHKFKVYTYSFDEINFIKTGKPRSAVYYKNKTSIDLELTQGRRVSHGSFAYTGFGSKSAEKKNEDLVNILTEALSKKTVV